MSDIIQNIIDAYHPPPVNIIDKYQVLQTISDNIIRDNIILKKQIKTYQYYIGVTCVLLSYVGLIYYIEK